MKKLFVSLCLILPLLAHAQDYKIFRRQGDSLKFRKKFAEAVVAYNKCIDLVLTGKQMVYDDEWNGLLSAAMDANKSNPRQYSELRYGTRAEKMSDKIATLKDMGVKYLFSFYSRTGGATQGSFSNWPYQCHLGFDPTYILVWGVNENIFMQAFDACNTYKPVKMNDPELYKLLKAHTDDLIKEKIKPMILKGHDGFAIYHFQFYTDNKTIEKEPMDIYDFRTMEQNYEPIMLKITKKASIDKGNDIYRSNIKTYFARLFLRIQNDEIQYHNVINSGTERARVGKFD